MFDPDTRNKFTESTDTQGIAPLVMDNASQTVHFISFISTFSLCASECVVRKSHRCLVPPTGDHGPVVSSAESVNGYVPLLPGRRELW